MLEYLLVVTTLGTHNLNFQALFHPYVLGLKTENLHFFHGLLGSKRDFVFLGNLTSSHYDQLHYVHKTFFVRLEFSYPATVPYYTRWWFQIYIAYFHPYLGKIPNLTIIFFRWVGEKPTTSVVLQYASQQNLSWHSFKMAHVNESPRNLCFTWASVLKITKKRIMKNPLNGGAFFNQFFSLRCIVRSSKNRYF